LQKLQVEAEIDPYLTGGAIIFIRNANDPPNTGHTLWGTGDYIFGHFVYPALKIFYPECFVPRLQCVGIIGHGYGYVTFWVNGTSG
jgi:hypothetical protein